MLLCRKSMDRILGCRSKVSESMDSHTISSGHEEQRLSMIWEMDGYINKYSQTHADR